LFGNFFYLIVALLIYVTYPPAEETSLTAGEAVFSMLGLLALFTYIARIQFRRIENRLETEPFVRLDHVFNARLTRQFILAIGLFAVDIYGLGLPSYLTGVRLLDAFPTLTALLFIALFLSYLAIIWALAYPAYRALYDSSLSRLGYVLSNISFNIPILLPWFLLSVVADIIDALPFELPRRLLATTGGQVAYFLVFLLAVAVFGPLFIQKFWRCRPLEAGYFRSRIEALCRRAGMRYTDILYWPIFGGRMITAGVMGLVNRFRYLLVTQGLLQFLNPEEIDAVIAHEIGHVKKKHLQFYLLFFAGYLLVSFASADAIIFSLIYARPVHALIKFAGIDQTTAFSVAFSLVTIVLFLLYFRYIFGFFMRNFERQADTYVFSLFDSALPLISTLQKIAATSGQPADKPNWHHFSIAERITFLRRCESDRGWIRRQDRKLKKGLAVFLGAMTVVGVFGWQLNFGEAGRRLNRHFFEKILLREIQASPHNPDLYQVLGDLYQGGKKFDRAIGAYQKGLTLAPDDPEMLNNLAWLLATCEDDRFRDPQAALGLARRATAIDPAPHILDTLAESYFVNGMYKEAVSVARAALAASRKNREYYQKQLEKFRRAGPGA
jgi:Zn-dependent protease with chaperone function